MTRILFVCHGNICRSPMAEFMMRDLAEKAGIGKSVYIESAATSTEELGNPVYHVAQMKLRENGIGCEGKTARQVRAEDYDRFDMIICMDENNLRNIKRIIPSDPDGKITRMLALTGEERDISDPWYTHDFDTTWRDLSKGCGALLEILQNRA